MINTIGNALPQQKLTYSNLNSTPIVVKEVVLSDQNEISLLLKEKKHLLNSCHPNLLTYYSIVHIINDSSMSITYNTEFMDLFDLHTFITNLTSAPPISLVRYTLSQILSALFLFTSTI
ncbi:hypothetical protein QTN25_002715 [Entamoeba marina]